MSSRCVELRLDVSRSFRALGQVDAKAVEVLEELLIGTD